MIFTKTFWKRTFERAVATAAQAPLSVVLVANISGNEVAVAWSQDWSTIGGVALMGAFTSLLKSLVATQVGDPQDPSFVP